MRLTTRNIHHYLVDKGFMEMRQLVDGDYFVTQGQTRNFIFRVNTRNEKSLFVKQLNSFDQNNTYILQKDATCLWLIKNTPAFEKLSSYVPHYFGYDPERQVLVTEYLANAINLEDHIRISGGLNDELIKELATILASYHFPVSEALNASSSIQFFPKQIPWILQIADTGSAGYQQLLSHSSAPVLNAVTENTVFKKLITGIKNDWLPISLIHGDLKWMNLLLHKENGQNNIKVIDWEIADIGDPLWDVAGILQSFVCDTLFYTRENTLPFNVVPGIGLADIYGAWPKINCFWQAYKEKSDHHQKLNEASLEKAIRYTGARLIQTATEHNMMMPALQPNAIKLLQASYAVLGNVPEILNLLQALPNPTKV